MDVARGVREACQEIRQAQATGIRIYCEKPPAPGILVWPKCEVELPSALKGSWYIPSAQLSWGKSTTITLRPQIEHSVTAYTQIPFGGKAGVARISCTLEENEVVQYVYRILKRPGNSYEEIYGEARLVQVENF